ncbi:MAG: hypothetical protein JNL88_10165 [Bacteroidia bacterium]|nr:hypothetical protein [Bacteroidia bacterium]
MPVVYRFRVTFEDYDEVTRDIEIKSTQFFSELHQTIQSSIGFDNSKPASFYMSNDNWIKGQEISTEPRTDKQGNKSVLMSDARLCDYIADPHQKIYYISDYDAAWTFQILLMKIVPQADPMKNYPACVKSTGEAPKQYVQTSVPKIIAVEDEEFNNLMMEEETDDTEDTAEDSILGDTEDGVEMEEIQGMSEEGEEEETEDGEGEVNYNESEEDQKEDY